MPGNWPICEIGLADAIDSLRSNACRNISSCPPSWFFTQSVNHRAGFRRSCVFRATRYADGSASHRLTINGREAVKRALKL